MSAEPTPPHPMQAATIAPPPLTPPQDPRVQRHTLLFDAYLERTVTALLESDAATSEHIKLAVRQCSEARDNDRCLEIIELVARIQGHDEEHMSKAIADLADGISSTLHNPPIHVPFAGKLIAPSAFYASYEQIHQAANHLLCPVIYAEDCDAIGTASINPIAAMLIAEYIGEIVHRRVGIAPFVTVARMDYESWAFLTRKHFEL